MLLLVILQNTLVRSYAFVGFLTISESIHVLFLLLLLLLLLLLPAVQSLVDLSFFLEVSKQYMFLWGAVGAPRPTPSLEDQSIPYLSCHHL